MNDLLNIYKVRYFSSVNINDRKENLRQIYPEKLDHTKKQITDPFLIFETIDFSLFYGPLHPKRDHQDRFLGIVRFSRTYPFEILFPIILISF